MSFPGCRKAPKILLPLLKGPHRLLNWQIQITRVSWVGQSTSFLHTLLKKHHVKMTLRIHALSVLFTTSPSQKSANYLRLWRRRSKTPNTINGKFLVKTSFSQLFQLVLTTFSFDPNAVSSLLVPYLTSAMDWHCCLVFCLWKKLEHIWCFKRNDVAMA